METIIQYLESISPVLAAFYATLFTWLVTALGASVVFFIKNTHQKFLNGMLGFTGGVMVAASIWSLLIPAIEMTKSEGIYKILPAVSGFLFGAISIFGVDEIMNRFYLYKKNNDGAKTPMQKTWLLILAITLHNIPEGLAVGVLFGGVAAGLPEASIAGAVALAIGIGLQNFPEGIAVSMPLRRLGLSRRKSFFYGQLSAVVEPLAGVLGAVAVLFFTPILPYALAFAAGAMMYMVAVEVIPESQKQDKKTGTLGFMLGFVVMMVLDVLLG